MGRAAHRRGVLSDAQRIDQERRAPRRRPVPIPSTAIAGPAVEPNVHPTIGAGVRIGRRFGVLAEVDRARAFTLLRGGLFVGW